MTAFYEFLMWYFALIACIAVIALYLKENTLIKASFDCVYFPEIINAIEMFDAVVKVESITKQALKEG